MASVTSKKKSVSGLILILTIMSLNLKKIYEVTEFHMYFGNFNLELIMNNEKISIQICFVVKMNNMIFKSKNFNISRK